VPYDIVTVSPVLVRRQVGKNPLDVTDGEVGDIWHDFCGTYEYHGGVGQPFRNRVCARRTEGHILLTQRFGWDI
jgi:hypothetical protein